MPITFCIVEDDRVTRESLISLLQREAGLHFLGAYSSAESALNAIPTVKPDVVLVDIHLAGGRTGIECVALLKTRAPETQSLILTSYEDSNLIFEALRAGAKGYLLKKASPEELVSAIEQVHAGGAPMSMSIARKVVDHFDKINRP